MRASKGDAQTKLDQSCGRSSTALSNGLRCDRRQAPSGSIEHHGLAERELFWRASTAPRTDLVECRLLGFNDFHGYLSTTQQVEGRPVGGASVLDSYLREASRGYEDATFVVHAGDLVGGSPPVSALYQDEPTIRFLELLGNEHCRDAQRANPQCNVIAGLGNHEFDDGTDELRRLVHGGNHERGPFLGLDYRGPGFEFIASNVIDSRTASTLVPSYTIREVEGIKVGFIGAVLAGATGFLIPSELKGIRFTDVTDSVRRSADELSRQGVAAIVVVLHEGGHQRFGESLPRDGSAVSGEIVRLVWSFPDTVDVVLAGHTHDAIHARLENATGKSMLVTQAYSTGTAFADIVMRLDRREGEVVETRSSVVTTWADRAPGSRARGSAVARFVERVEASVKERTSRIIGVAAQPMSSMPDRQGRSALGSLVADAQRAAAETDLAFVTPSWVRSGLDRGPVTWGELFGVQPFGHRLFKVELRGAEVLALLEQQWEQDSQGRVLHVSGLEYSWHPERPPGRRVGRVLHEGVPVNRDTRYTAVVGQVLAEGGEGFTVLGSAPRSATALLDIDALVTYVERKPKLSGALDGRIQAATE